MSGGERQGESYSLYTFASGLRAVFGHLVGGWLYNNASHAAPFYFNAALAFAGALLIALLVREPQCTEVEA